MKSAIRERSKDEKNHITKGAKYIQQIKGDDAVVNKKLKESGCNKIKAKQIASLGIKCAAYNENARSFIEGVIHELGQIQ